MYIQTGKPVDEFFMIAGITFTISEHPHVYCQIKCRKAQQTEHTNSSLTSLRWLFISNKSKSIFTS